MNVDKLKLFAAVAVVAAALFAYYWWPDASQLLRTAGIVAALVVGALIALTTEPGRRAWSFAIGARNEVRKVIWPTRRETAQATGVVILMVIVVGIYIWMLDWISLRLVYDLMLGVRQ